MIVEKQRKPPAGDAHAGVNFLHSWCHHKFGQLQCNVSLLADPYIIAMIRYFVMYKPSSIAGKYSSSMISLLRLQLVRMCWGGQNLPVPSGMGLAE